MSARPAVLVLLITLAGCGGGSSSGVPTEALAARHALALAADRDVESRALAADARAARAASVAPTVSLTASRANALQAAFLKASKASTAAPPHVIARTAPKLTVFPPATSPLPSSGERQPGPHDTSEYLAGKVAVSLVLVDGPGHRFSDADAAAALADTVEAMDLWVKQEPQARLSFVYDVHRARVSVDAIERPSSERSGWLREALARILGRPSTDEEEDAYELDRQARAKLGTDWAVTFFFVRAATGAGELIDGKATFPDGAGAYTLLGGPYGVVPYSRVWGCHFWNAPIIAHELGHFFYALDEYSAYAKQGHVAAEETGYLDATNPNLDDAKDATMDEHCLMRGSFRAVMDYLADHLWSALTFGHAPSWDYNVCSATLAQLGATRTASGRTPPTDVAPWIEARVQRSGPDVTVEAHAAPGVLPNRNPYRGTAHPSNERRDLSIDPIVSVRVSAGTASAGAPLQPSAWRVELSQVLAGVPSGAPVTVEVVTRSGLAATKTLRAP